MNNSQKILKMLSGFIEAGILTTNDLERTINSCQVPKRRTYK